jgi:hypothetical protein
MSDFQPRTDLETAKKVDEAIAMKLAFGDDVARKFLLLRGIDPELAERVITAPREQRRH